MGENRPVREDLPQPGVTAERARPTRVRYAVLAVACSVAVISYIHRVGFASATTAFKDELHLSSEQLSQLMTAFLVAYALFEVPGGVLGDRLGVRHLLTLLVLCWSLLTGAVALVAGLPAVWVMPFLLGVRFLFGMFQAGGFPSLSRMMTDWMPMQERASAQGLIWMSSRLGGAVVPLILAGLFPLVGWRLALCLVAGLGVVWCAGFWPWFRNRPEEMPRVNAAERELIVAGRARRPTGHAHLPWSCLVRSRSVVCLCLLYGFGGLGSTFFITNLPDYLKNYRGLTVDQTSWLTSLPLACGVVACVVGGLLSDWLIRRTGNARWSRRLNGMVGHAGAGLAILASLWVPDQRVVLLAAALALTFFCNDLGMGPAWACCADIGGRCAGTVGGAMNMIGNLGAALGSLLYGAWIGRDVVLPLPAALGGDHHIAGNTLVFVVYAGCYGLGCLSWLGVNVDRPLEVADGVILPTEPEP